VMRTLSALLVAFSPSLVAAGVILAAPAHAAPAPAPTWCDRWGCHGYNHRWGVGPRYFAPGWYGGYYWGGGNWDGYGDIPSGGNDPAGCSVPWTDCGGVPRCGPC